MNRNSFILVLLFLCLACRKKEKEISTISETTNVYSNPILQGFYPDPSICKVEGEFYMVNSTFAYFPGIPIFKSSDLVNWKQIGNVLDRPEQLNLDGLGVSRGIFAPAISYNDGTFYLVSTLIDGKNNFVVTAKQPEGPWSNPTWLPEVSGIDPSLFFDKTGKTYIVYNSEAPNDSPEYDGHRSIKMLEFNSETLQTIGTPKVIINKGAKLQDKPIWIEGPHIYQLNGYYYLMAAEGGTAEGHSEVVFRSKSVEGPYESYKNNPILTQRHLDDNRNNPITSTGHADIIQDNFGNWYGVFLGCRPYDNNNHFNTGRETFMVPVSWKEDWPVFELGTDSVSKKYPTPNNVVKQEMAFKNSGEYTFKADFNTEKLDFEWLFLRTPREQWYHISESSLQIKTRPESVSKLENPSFIGHRQQHKIGEVSTELTFMATSENEKAGLIVFQNESHFYYLCQSFKNKKPVVQLFKSNEDNLEEIASEVIEDVTTIEFKIEAKGSYYNFLYAINGNDDWKLLKENADASFLSTNVAGGFVGTIYGMYTTSLGKLSDNTAKYNWFQIINKD